MRNENIDHSAVGRSDLRIVDYGAVAVVDHRTLGLHTGIEERRRRFGRQGPGANRGGLACGQRRRRFVAAAVVVDADRAAPFLDFLADSGMLGRRGINQLVVLGHDQFRLSAHEQFALIQQQRSVAQVDYRAAAMGDEEDRAATMLNRANPRKTLALEGLVADREGFVNDEDVRLDADGYREGQPHVHAAAVGFHRPLDKLAELGKGDDVIESGRDLGLTQAHHRGAGKDIVASAEFGVEAGPQLKQGGHAAVDGAAPGGGREGSANQLQEGRFAAAVAAHDAYRLAAADLKGNVVEGPEFAKEAAAAVKQGLLQTILGRSEDAVALSQVFDADGYVRRQPASGQTVRSFFFENAHNAFGETRNQQLETSYSGAARATRRKS